MCLSDPVAGDRSLARPASPDPREKGARNTCRIPRCCPQVPGVFKEMKRCRVVTAPAPQPPSGKGMRAGSRCSQVPRGSRSGSRSVPPNDAWTNSVSSALGSASSRTRVAWGKPARINRASGNAVAERAAAGGRSGCDVVSPRRCHEAVARPAHGLDVIGRAQLVTQVAERVGGSALRREWLVSGQKAEKGPTGDEPPRGLARRLDRTERRERRSGAGSPPDPARVGTPYGRLGVQGGGIEAPIDRGRGHMVHVARQVRQ